MKPHTAPAPKREHEAAAPDPRRLEKVRAIFVSLPKYLNAKTIYADNSPHVAKFRDTFHQSLRDFFQHENELVLTVEQYQIRWREETVYDNREKKDSLAFLLYKDGVGEITFHAAVKPDELEQFVDLMQKEISCPSTQADIVSRLWQAEFAGISHRVFDEYSDGKQQGGRGAGSDSGEQQLRVNDHPSLLGDERSVRGDSALITRSAESLGKHLNAIIEHDHPGASAQEKEQHLQRKLESLFTVRAEELAPWQQAVADLRGRNKLLWLLESMLDFTRMKHSQAVARDVLDIILRLVRSITEEMNIPSLLALLDIQKKMAESGEMTAGFESLPQRIKHELTGTSFLLALGKKAGRSRAHVHEIMEYFQLIGNNAVPALREILATSGDSTIHAEVCDALLAIARDYIMSIIEDLKLENPLEAQDAIYLLQRCATTEMPPIIEKFLSSPDPHVRGSAAPYLAENGTDEAALLLCKLLEDGDKDVRIGTLAAVEELKNPSIIAKVTAMCFEEATGTRGIDELERAFRTAAKLAGAGILPRIQRMAASRGFFPIGGSRTRQNKLLAITALKCIPGPESHETLRKLAGDGDGLVRSKALHALTGHDEHGDAGSHEEALAAAGGENND